MCRVDLCDESIDPAWPEERTARKEHRCNECCRTIRPGEHYEHFRGFWEGEGVVYKTCAHCMVARGWLSKVCGGWIFSEVLDELVEHFREVEYADLALGRLAVGMRRRWQRFDGVGLMALPVVVLPKALQEPAVAS